LNMQMLQKQYGYNEPIILNDIKNENISKNTLRQIMKRLVDKGELGRYNAGVYYIPKKSTLLNKSYFDGNKAVKAKYIISDNRIFGYFTGMTFANQIGVTTQVPVQKEIATNIETTAGRIVSMADKVIRIKKPRTVVTNENWQVLQLLDLINESDKWSEISTEDEMQIMEKYIRDKNLNKEIMIQCIKYYPDRVAKKLIESRLIYVFAS